jgi:hypothetical protein
VRSDDSSRIQDVVRWLGGSNVMLSRAQPSPVFDAGMTITSTGTPSHSLSRRGDAEG